MSCIPQAYLTARLAVRVSFPSRCHLPDNIGDAPAPFQLDEIENDRLGLLEALAGYPIDAMLHRTLHDRVGSIARITAPQHCCLLYPS